MGSRLDEDGPDATTICKFRARLIANGRAGDAFVRTLLWAREHKVLGRKIDELADATAVLGAGAVQNTLTLLRKARRKLARSLRGSCGACGVGGGVRNGRGAPSAGGPPA